MPQIAISLRPVLQLSYISQGLPKPLPAFLFSHTRDTCPTHHILLGLIILIIDIKEEKAPCLAVFLQSSLSSSPQKLIADYFPRLYILLGCDILQCHRLLPKFRRNIMSSSSRFVFRINILPPSSE